MKQVKKLTPSVHIFSWTSRRFHNRINKNFRIIPNNNYEKKLIRTFRSWILSLFPLISALIVSKLLSKKIEKSGD